MWHNVDEIETAIQNFATTYPALATDFAAEPTWAWTRQLRAHGQRPAHRANAAGAADGVLLIFGQHAREWIPRKSRWKSAALLAAYTQHGLTYGGKSYSAADVQTSSTTSMCF